MVKITETGKKPETGFSVDLGSLGTDLTNPVGEVSPTSPLPKPVELGSLDRKTCETVKIDRVPISLSILTRNIRRHVQ